MKSATKATKATKATNASPEMTSLIEQVGSTTLPPKLDAVVSAKQFIRNALAGDKEYTVAELCTLSGKTEVNVKTMLSDLRSPKYCGKQGVFATVGIKRADGKTYYSKAITTQAS